MPRIHPETRRRARELRQNQTPAEATLWARLRDRRLAGLKFRRQQPIGPYIADFYYPEGRLVIELDGAGHLKQQDYDRLRSDWLYDQGCRVIRFTNDEVKYQLDAVLQAILRACEGESG